MAGGGAGGSGGSGSSGSSSSSSTGNSSSSGNAGFSANGSKGSSNASSSGPSITRGLPTKNRGNNRGGFFSGVNSAIDAAKHSSGAIPSRNGNKNGADDAVKSAVEKARQNNMKDLTKKAIGTAANAVAPGAGEVAKKLLETEKGDRMLDEATKDASNPVEAAKNFVQRMMEDETKKRILLSSSGFLIFVFILILAVAGIFSKADSQSYAEDNSVLDRTENIPEIDEIRNQSSLTVYYGLYEKIINVTEEINKKYGTNVDRLLILSTLVYPIESGKIRKGESMYREQDGKEITWDEVIEIMKSEVDYLAKAQIMTVKPDGSGLCKGDNNVKQYAKNDEAIVSWQWWNPWTWFSGYRTLADAEVNAKCTKATGQVVPDVYMTSKDRGVLQKVIDYMGTPSLKEDPEKGGVYFWNLVNQNGFIFIYFKDYLSIDPLLTEEDNYKNNLPAIAQIADFIYTYYDDLEKNNKYCEGYPVLKNDVTEITVKDETGNIIGTYDLEYYVSGVIAAEFSGSALFNNADGTKNNEALKAFSILARTYGLNYVGDGSNIIEASSNNQNFNKNWENSSVADDIREAVEATKGMVVTKNGALFSSEYDAFCPTNSYDEWGYFYLAPGQRNLPIEADWVYNHIPQSYLTCPCIEPLFGADPSCYAKGEYDPSGGHGRGVSQWGLRYFAEKGYNWEELLKLFEDRDNEHIRIMRLSSSIEAGKCVGAKMNISGENGEEGPDIEVPPSGGSSTCVSYSGTVKSTKATKVLQGTSIESLLKKKGCTINDYNKFMYSELNKAGMGTTNAVVTYALALIQGLDETFNVRMPYYYTGGHHLTKNEPINGNWGAKTNPYYKFGNTYRYAGFDCTGFIGYAIYYAGFDYMSRSADGMKGIGPTKSLSTCDAKPGDLVWSKGHMRLVLAKKGNSLIVAEAKGLKYGVLINELKCSGSDKKIVSMSAWYSKHKR